MEVMRIEGKKGFFVYGGDGNFFFPDVFMRIEFCDTSKHFPYMETLIELQNNREYLYTIAGFRHRKRVLIEAEDLT